MGEEHASPTFVIALGAIERHDALKLVQPEHQRRDALTTAEERWREKPPGALKLVQLLSG